MEDNEVDLGEMGWSSINSIDMPQDRYKNRVYIFTTISRDLLSSKNVWVTKHCTVFAVIHHNYRKKYVSLKLVCGVCVIRSSSVFGSIFASLMAETVLPVIVLFIIIS